MKLHKPICNSIDRVQGVLLALLLAAILALFAQRVQAGLRAAFARRPGLLPATAAGFAAAFSASLAALGAFRWELALTASVYLLAPAALAYKLGPGSGKDSKAGDFLVVLLLWLPLEFAAGSQWVPRPLQGAVHSVAYGFAILLALVVFLCFRALPGMKYNLPRSGRDALYPLAGYALAAPLLLAAGLWLGFIPWFHPPRHGASGMVLRFLAIFAATALPEEILFRSLIQNLLMLRFGPGHRTLAAAAAIFGCSHLNNGPLAAPNWRYAVIAAIAGAAFGKVFQKSSTVLSSAALHAMVNATKHFFL